MLKLSSHQFATLLDSMREVALSGGSDKRQTTRMEVQARVCLAPLNGQTVGQPFTALSRDISITGAGLMQRSPSKSGDKFVVAFPHGKTELALVCQTMYCMQLAEGVYGIGARFDGIADASLVAQMRALRESQATRPPTPRAA